MTQSPLYLYVLLGTRRSQNRIVLNGFGKIGLRDIVVNFQRFCR